MKSVIYANTGDSSVLQLVERDVPEPGLGEVRVRIIASGVNPTDWKNRIGTRPKEFAEVVPHHDGAGIIDALGAEVTSVQVGDRVWLNMAQHESPEGTAQEFTVVPVSKIAPLPDHVGFDVGASIGVPAITAHRALTVHESGPSRLSPGALDGRVVLVQGGAGAVGNSAIQLAVWAGATVIATVSSEPKAELARAAGAHHVLRYPSEQLAAEILAIAPNGVDHIAEVSPKVNVDLDVAVVANQGSIAFYANNHGSRFTTSVIDSMVKNIRWQGILLYTLDDEAMAAAVADVGAALEDGAISVGEDAGLPLTWFPLEETAAAHDAVEHGAVGKVLIRVAQDPRG